MLDLAGIYPPTITPFRENEGVAYDKRASNLEKWLGEPLDGIVMSGSNSESVFLTRDERETMWQVCRACLKGSGKRLIAGTGCESTAETMALTQKASELGADAALVLPPYFYKAPLTPKVLITHYLAVAEASPIPLLVYNVPASTEIDFAPSTLLKMAEHARSVGFKDSSANVTKVASVLAVRPDFQVFAGTGSALVPFLILGAAGGIMALANFAAAPLRRVWEAFFEGRIEEARGGPARSGRDQQRCNKPLRSLWPEICARLLRLLWRSASSAFVALRPRPAGRDRRHALPNQVAKYDDGRSLARHAFSN
jgi:4-hydroxy-2-oxoglutarate aldolase